MYLKLGVRCVLKGRLVAALRRAPRSLPHLQSIEPLKILAGALGSEGITVHPHLITTWSNRDAPNDAMGF